MDNKEFKDAIDGRVKAVEEEIASIKADLSKAVDGEGTVEISVATEESVPAPTTEVASGQELLDEYGLTDKMKKYLMDYIMSVEGGYFNHPNDPGGPTNYGIIQSEARRWGYKGDMRNFPKELAVKIYLKDYWKDIKLMEIKSFLVALCIFDMQVNGGTAGVLIAQRTVNRLGVDTLSEDRKIGPKTIAAINKCDPDKFIEKYCELQRAFYISISNAKPKLKVFLKGWNNRVDAKIRFIRQMKADGIK